MPRRAAIAYGEVPLFLIPHVIRNGIRTHGDELERVTVKKMYTHRYNVSIRTRPIRHELRASVPHTKPPATHLKGRSDAA